VSAVAGRTLTAFAVDAALALALLAAALVLPRRLPTAAARATLALVTLAGVLVGVVGAVDVFFALAFGAPLTPAQRAWGHAASPALAAAVPLLAAVIALVALCALVVLAWRRPPSIRAVTQLGLALGLAGLIGRGVDHVVDDGRVRRQLGLDDSPVAALLWSPATRGRGALAAPREALGDDVVDARLHDRGPGQPATAVTAPVLVQREHRPRHVVLYVAESLAARFVDDETMPRLAALQRQSLVFTDHVAQSPISIKALFSLLCGLHPRPGDELETTAVPALGCASLSEVLAAAGFDAALFHGGYFAFTDKLAFLSERGFQRLVDGENHPRRASTWTNGWGIDDRAVVDEALAWLDGRGDPARPSLLVVVPLVPHHEYFLPPDAPTPFGTATLRDRYRNALRFADDVYARLVDGYRRRGILDDTLFVFVGDHGEAFDEHPRNRLHGSFLYEENLRVPLVLSSRALPPATSSRPSSHADVLPTVLDLLGVTLPARAVVQGQSLVGDAYRPAATPLFTAVPTARVGVRGARWKLIHDVAADRDELFDLVDDPRERRDRSADEPALAAALRRRALRYLHDQPALLSSLPQKEPWLARVARDNGLALAVTRVFNMERRCIPVASAADAEVVVELRGLHPPARLVGLGVDDHSRQRRRGPLDAVIEAGGRTFAVHVDDRFETSSAVIDVPAADAVRVRVRPSTRAGVTGCLWLAP
jgi:arylsulfatase A-like enzyme